MIGNAMNRKSRITTATLLAVGLLATMAAPLPAHAVNNTSAAYRRGFDLFNAISLDHTYFCLNRLNNGSDCFTIVGFGVGSNNSGGEMVAGTRYDKSTHQRCLARSRASNSLASACGFFSELYGINGVCHQHTNRGQLSMHGSFMNPSSIRGGWFSFAAYGPYGIAYPGCFVGSEASCAFTW